MPAGSRRRPAGPVPGLGRRCPGQAGTAPVDSPQESWQTHVAFQQSGCRRPTTARIRSSGGPIGPPVLVEHTLRGLRHRTRAFDLLRERMSPTSFEVPYGTLDLMVLKTLDTMSPLHGYGIARRIEQIAQGSLALNQGTIYPGAAAARAEGLDQERVGHQREQPPRPLLRDHPRRPQAAAERDRQLDANRRDDEPAARGARAVTAAAASSSRRVSSDDLFGASP